MNDKKEITMDIIKEIELAVMLKCEWIEFNITIGRFR
jgi:hypothetical protein